MVPSLKNNTGYNVIFTELKDQFVYEDTNIKITAFLNDHGDLQESYGFFIQTADKKFLFLVIQQNQKI